jgi:anti-sigma factor RsiW
MNAHCTERELLEWTMGTSTREVAQHLESCPACRTEADILPAAIGRFRESVRAEAQRSPIFWSRQRAGIRERISLRRPAFLLRWGLLAAMALLAVLLLVRSPQLPQQASNDAADDALLQQVESSVQQGVPTALGPAALISQERNSALFANTEGNSKHASTNQDKEQYR